MSRTPPKDSEKKESGSTDGDSPAEKDAGDSNSVLSPKPKESERKSVGECEAQAAEGTAKSDIDMCPPTRLGQFYEFFSFSYLTPPVQCEFPFSLVSRILRLISLVDSDLLIFQISEGLFVHPKMIKD